MKIAAELMRAARLISAGVSRKPSRLVIRNATPQIGHGLRDAVELHERDDAEAAGDDHRAEVGNRVEDPGEQPPDDVLLQAEPPERRDVATATSTLVSTCTRMKLSIWRLISSRICTVSFLSRERRPRDLHQLPLVEIAGDRKK